MTRRNSQRTSRERSKRGKNFRTGQQVRSIYEPQRSFRIDKSIQPERLFHEEGSDRWYTRSELLALGDAKSIRTRVDAAMLEAIGKSPSAAFQAIS